MTTDKKHVAVLLGGWSSEREVSLSSGKGCVDGLQAKGYRVTEVDVGRDLAAVLDELKPDVAFNALHGQWGEDGCVQGLLEVMGIPYTHSGVLASSLAMDKQKAKQIFASVGIPIAEGKLVPLVEAAHEHVMKPPYVIKPNADGSSVGVFIVRPGDNRPPETLLKPGAQLGEVVLVERFIGGRELTCAVIDGQASAVTEIIVPSDFYDFDAKYAAGGSTHIVEADLPEDITQEIQRMTLLAHETLGCRGVSRTDFRYDAEAGELIILELNTQPGMTPTSLVPELAQHKGVSYADLVAWMVEDSSCRR